MSRSRALGGMMAGVLLAWAAVACSSAPAPKPATKTAQANKNGPTNNDPNAANGAGGQPTPPSPADVSANKSPPISPSSPKLTAIDPTSAPVSTGTTVTLTLTGNQFANGAMVAFGDQAVKPVSATATQVTVNVPTSLLATAATLPIKVQNPPTNGGASNALSFTVVSQGGSLSISGVDPQSAEQGNARTLTLTVTGAGFTQNCRVRLNGTDLKTTFRNTQQLTAALPGNLLKLAGSVSVTVFNPQGGSVSTPVPFQVTRSTSAAVIGTGAGGQSCQNTCADFGYSSGQCFQDWTCTNGCLVAGACPAQPSCDFRCSAYNYTAGQCVGDWQCRTDGCLVPKSCGGTSSASGSTSTVAASCAYPCNDPSGAWSYNAGECTNGYQCGADGCLHAATCSASTGTSGAATCEYPCVDPSGAWSYAAGECSAGYECGSDNCLHQKVCSTATGTGNPTTSTTTCSFPCVDPFGAYSYDEYECKDSYCCISGCLVADAQFEP